ncbi:mitochondrial chaperone Frataxin [Cordyceps fumosorosea ARSEF 2679]|uniref:ferroxidase n=1 Tax=Cordyceps fumosorosea (strain ARSEF 2679) TaxID=1081104 RepID=A0A162J300_CORFA|nr:mitochondrial chaperone Frataxin [Cordyceps fumosorosea ARSEF 2679]OAA63052.1 mitochondrial chaperone Frataxin [Cordyceps fumosorosea ARSEF 2679]
MPRTSLVQASRLASRALARSPATRAAAVRAIPPVLLSHSAAAPPAARRTFTLSTHRRKGIMPDTESPAAKEPPASPEPTYGAVELSESEYHEIADEFLEGVLTQFEALQDTREDIDIEFASGVMTITHSDKGTYVINKQPPNKQLWLSSPLSGPKRYDWCVVGEGQADKAGTGQGSWVYARDGSSLDELIREELGVDVSAGAAS